MYDSGEYAGTRINQTVVLFKREPVYVEQVRYDKTVVGRTVGRGGHKIEKPLTSMNLTDFRLGYFNSGGVAYYMSRKALRHDWRQGLRLNNVECVPYKGDIALEDIAVCLRQRLPTFSKAMAKLGAGASSCAWCKDFCITRFQTILWKGHPVGAIADDKITLDNKFKFLTKLMKEITHECYEVV